MLGRQTVQKVERLISAGVPIRKIARILGVARGTVHAIRNGTHASYRRDPSPDGLREVHFCPRCGAMVEVPCVACAIRDYAENIQPVAESFEPLGVDLLPDDYKRYLEIRKEKEREDESIANFQKMEREEREREWEREANFKIGRIDAPFRKAA